ncbi:hypothetical protein [Mycolicibacterium goodii]|uniref:MFS transporter n=1 Tax=Mycolicibacterium goodii TaxID=134601 RepID=A0ABS6HY42_MYCGD|nr:hypothetical protein [Mycolicibacterium goodii]OKH72527.1 membrane protein [Mycobacterium sp. SWH-M5]MBU8827577.1 hypothetical protein [Mycolicibacterium goodii]MBU8834270.1 hypothetical protein [Mycolicibacterium goodii]MBU8841301.1 hypothetical protein [Mycolicibacterium goodii]ULN50339.1 hypothetical protein MI170_13980 [Mycolicibacterium goodii]
MTKFLDGYLESPLSGIAPWVVMAVLSTPGHFEQAVCAALGLTLLTMWISRRRGGTLHALDLYGAGFFVILAVIGLIVSPDAVRWLQEWAGEISNIALALFVIATIVARRPFTLPYAKEQTPQEHWDGPLFLRVNYLISAVWAGAFTVSAIVGFIGNAVLHDPDNFWTGWVLQLASIFFAVAFTGWYPDRAAALAEQAGEPSETTTTTTTVAQLFDWLPMFVLIAGIFGWVTDAIPDAAGIAMIVLGIAGNALAGRVIPAREDASTEKA